MNSKKKFASIKVGLQNNTSVLIQKSINEDQQKRKQNK